MHQIIGADLSTSVPLPFACSGPPVDGVYSPALEGGDHRPCAPLSQAQPPWVRPHTTDGLAPMRAPTFVFVSVWDPLATSLHIRPYTRPYTHLLTPVPTHVPTHTHLRRPSLGWPFGRTPSPVLPPNPSRRLLSPRARAARSPLRCSPRPCPSPQVRPPHRHTRSRGRAVRTVRTPHKKRLTPHKWTLGKGRNVGGSQRSECGRSASLLPPASGTGPWTSSSRTANTCHAVALRAGNGRRAPLCRETLPR